MNKHTWRELERADMDTAAAHSVEMELRAEQIMGRKAASMSEYIIPLDEIESAMGDLGKTIYEAYKWREIVRCVDCKHYNDTLCEISSCWLCDECQQTEPDGFCKWGERRDA